MSTTAPRRVEVGIGLQADKPPGAYARLARVAEEHGIDVISVYADLMFQPPLPALLEIAGATSTVRLGPACFNPFTMHPYEIAGQIAALDLASDGRAFLGLAARHMARCHRDRPTAAVAGIGGGSESRSDGAPPR